MRAILATLFLCSAFGLIPARAEPSSETIARGKSLTEAADCSSCHTTDPAKPFAGGRRLDTPFGAIYSANLTPDRDTGLGAWSDEEFYRAVHLGVGRNGTRSTPRSPTLISRN
jgi:mono/diheme cytochrome c family protein